ncbi:hypothetical protein M199_gp220 [Halogranum tailed virus 1]|uniref:Uncharacterized protein n=1 Tax=Halogranum tailed virus 1 TaxID=1273749 RepID=R4TGS1_9CAUD|nr:hypothetical protein M199_gp220 [Halogranum tailed virus 1]AGM11446.1 hypothetical protein HGTV1_149 [Halogranum tailed virus 1]
MSSSLLDFARENPIEYDDDKFFDYLRAFKKADRSFKKAMGWSGPRGLTQYSSSEMHDYYKRVLAEAYDHPRIDFDDALIGFMLVLGGYSYDNVKNY